MEYTCKVLIFTPPYHVGALVTCMGRSAYCAYYPILVASVAAEIGLLHFVSSERCEACWIE